MEKRISSTEASRKFAELINRVKYGGEEFVVERRGEEMCRIVPNAPKEFTVKDAVKLLRSLPKPDPGFARDVRRIRRMYKPTVPKSPWDS